MKWVLIIIFLGLTVFEVDKKINSANRDHHSKKSYQSFAILELFTSEGCSSCPPADRLLPQLASTRPISFHYLFMLTIGIAMDGKILLAMRRSLLARATTQNNLNWKAFILRKSLLMVEYELVGSNKSLAENRYNEVVNGKRDPYELTIDNVKKENDKLSVSCRLKGDFQNCDLLAAVVQKHAEVNVKAGENHGAKLSHTNVVRSFLEIGGKRKNGFPDFCSEGDNQR